MVAALLLLLSAAHESVRPRPIEEAVTSAPPRSAPDTGGRGGGGRTAFGGAAVALVDPAVPGRLLTAVVWPNHCTPSPRCSKMRVVVPVFLSRHTPSRARIFGPPASNCFSGGSAGVSSEYFEED